MPNIFPKLVLILAIFGLETKAGKKNNILLEKVLCIYCLVWFKTYKMKDLFNFNNKNNTISLENASKLGLKIYHINIGAQKINNSTFKMFEKV